MTDQPARFTEPPRDPVRCPRCGWRGEGRGGEEGGCMRYEETQYGFIYGPVEIQRISSYDKEGCVTIGATTQEET